MLDASSIIVEPIHKDLWIFVIFHEYHSEPTALLYDES